MKTIRVTRDAHGYEIRSSRATRYVPARLMTTCCETFAIRETLTPGKPVAVNASNLRAPGDWPSQTLAETGAELRRRVVAELSAEFSRMTGLEVAA